LTKKSQTKLKKEDKMVTQKITKRYSEAFKEKVISEISSGKYLKTEAANVYGISIGSIHQWVNKSGKRELLNKVVYIKMANEKDKIKGLEKQKKELESALAKAHLEILALKTSLEVYEEGKKNKKKGTAMR
jgi:transposase-like protein